MTSKKYVFSMVLVSISNQGTAYHQIGALPWFAQVKSGHCPDLLVVCAPIWCPLIPKYYCASKHFFTCIPHSVSLIVICCSKCCFKCCSMICWNWAALWAAVTWANQGMPWFDCMLGHDLIRNYMETQTIENTYFFKVI